MKFHPTNWPEHLLYAYHPQRKCWFFFSAETKKPVGYPYPCRATLLADMKRYAHDLWGLETPASP